MSEGALTRADLAEAIYQNVGLSRHESASLVETVLEIICSTLAQGEAVKISSFGTWQVRHKEKRIGRNPKTKEEAVIKPRRVITFRPSQTLKKVVNGEGSWVHSDEDEG